MARTKMHLVSAAIGCFFFFFFWLFSPRRAVLTYPSFSHGVFAPRSARALPDMRKALSRDKKRETVRSNGRNFIVSPE